MSRAAAASVFTEAQKGQQNEKTQYNIKSSSRSYVCKIIITYLLC